MTQPQMVIIDGIRYLPDTSVGNKVSVWGMYDCHAFERYQGRSVDEIFNAWLDHKPDPTYGETALCPIIVMHNDKELRRVGPMVHGRQGPENAIAMRKWLAAAKADPEIESILRASPSAGIKS